MSNEYKLSYTAAQINSKLGEIDYLVKDEELGSLAKKDIISKTDVSSDIQSSLNKADTALQSFTETDPTVPSWAKEPTKPAYTANEVGARPNTWMPTAADVGALPRDGSTMMTGNLGITNDWAGMAFINPNGVTGNIFTNPDADNMFVGMSTDGNNNGIVVGENCLQYLSNDGTKYNDILHTGNKNLITPWDIGAASADMSNVDMTALATALGGTKIATGSYVGTGTFKEANPNTLTFSFAPKLVIVAATYLKPYNNYWNDSFIWLEGDTINSVGGSVLRISVSGNTMSYYTIGSDPGLQCNNSGTTYHYIAIG